MILRKLTVDDLNFLIEVRNDESTRKFLENDSEFTSDECKSWFESYNPLWFIIEVNEEPVGYIRTNGDEVGCDIHPDFRKKVYARQAYNLYLENKNYATLWVFENNFAKKLYESLGFVETGEVKIVRGEKYLHMKYIKEPVSKIFIGGFGGTGSRVVAEIFEGFGFYVGREIGADSLDFGKGSFVQEFDASWRKKDFKRVINFVKKRLKNPDKFAIKHGHFMFINDVLRKDFPKCKTVYIMRHPIDMAVKKKYIPHNKYGNIGINDLDGKIKYYINESIKSCKEADLVIKYEDLCFDLENQLKIIRDFIGDLNLDLPKINIKPSKSIGQQTELYDKYDTSMLGY